MAELGVPGSKQIRLEVNYRCPPDVTTLARHVLDPTVPLAPTPAVTWAPFFAPFHLSVWLSDSLRLLPAGCACGSAFPAIEVHGRADHTVVLHDAQQREVKLLPLALATAIEEGAQVTRFQLLCTAPDRLELRFESGQADANAAFDRARNTLRAFLATHGVHGVRVAQGHAPPMRSGRSGKLQRVLMQPGPTRRRGGAAT
jgi:hypothetical protein